MKRLMLLTVVTAAPCLAQVCTFSIEGRPQGGMITLGWRASPGT